MSTWNPIRARNRTTGKLGWHCEHVTTGCKHCYAERLNMRLGTGLPFKPGHHGDIEIFLDEDMLTAPLRWRKPRMIFVCSMSDLFADFVEDRWIDKIFAVMALCPQHTFQVLTKRAERMRRWMIQEKSSTAPVECIAELYVDNPSIGERWPFDEQRAIGIGERGWPLPNVWLGVSAERQQEADERIPHLLATPAAVRFVSAEPLLGPIDFQHIAASEKVENEEWTFNASATGDIYYRRVVNEFDERVYWDSGDGPCRDHAIDWVIVGGESGKRPMHPDWARSIRDQCRAADIPFFFKQRGSFTWMDKYNHNTDEIPELPSNWRERTDGKYICMRADATMADGLGGDSAEFFYCVGKKAAGRLLDGREWNEMPAVKTAEAAA